MFGKTKRNLLMYQNLYLRWIHRYCRVLLLSVFLESRTSRPFVLLKLAAKISDKGFAYRKETPGHFKKMFGKRKRYLLTYRNLYLGWIHRFCDRVLLLSVFSASRTSRPILLKLLQFHFIFLCFVHYSLTKKQTYGPAF